jgi:HK97 gp10 family phage protein
VASEVSFAIKKMLDSIDGIERKFSMSSEKSVEKTAEFIRDEAKKRAPVDTGELEDNIRVVKRRNFEVSVISDSKSRSGFPYALFLHENRNWNLGEKSKRKQNSQSERVGSQYLLRAYTENQKETVQVFVDEMKKNVKEVII